MRKPWWNGWHLEMDTEDDEEGRGGDAGTQFRGQEQQEQK